MSRRDSPIIDLLRAAAVMLVFPARVVIFLGMIYAIGAGNRLTGVILMAVGILAYVAVAKIMATRPHARLDLKRRSSTYYGHDLIRSDRPTKSVSEVSLEGHGPPTPLTKGRRKYAEW